MTHGELYEYDKYLFGKQSFKSEKSDARQIVTYRSYRTDSTLVNIGFSTKTLERGWTSENIKIVLVLHPKDPQKFYELKYVQNYKEDQVDADGANLSLLEIINNM